MQLLVEVMRVVTKQENTNYRRTAMQTYLLMQLLVELMRFVAHVGDTHYRKTAMQLIVGDCQCFVKPEFVSGY